MKPWVYRILAVFTILFTAFTITFTVSFFIPGLESGIDHCPSAYSSENIKISASDENAAEEARIRSDKRHNNASYAAKNFSSDPVIRHKQLLTSLLDLAKDEKNEIKISKGYDKYWTVAIAESCKENTKNDLPISYTRVSVIAIIALDIALLVTLYILKRKVFKNQNKIKPKSRNALIILSVVGLLIFITLNLGTNVEDRNPNGKCNLAKAFTAHNQIPLSKYTYFQTLIISNSSYTRTDKEFYQNAKTARNFAYTTPEQQKQMLSDYKTISKEYKSIYNDAKKDPDFIQNAKNAKTSMYCISKTRLKIARAAFLIMVTFGIIVFNFGKWEIKIKPKEDL